MINNEVQRERQFLGVWIPKELWFAKELTLQEKCFLAEIHSLDREEGCIASNNHFSVIFNLSKNRCSEIIKKLEKIGAIKITYIYNDKKIEKRIINIKRLYGLQKKIEYDTYSISQHTPSESRQTPSENLEGRITIKNNSLEIYDQNEKIGNSLEHLEESFNEFWSLYPRKIAKAKAKLSFSSALKKTNSKVILEGVKNYLKEIETKKTEEKYIKHPSTWLNQECWNDEYVSSLNSSAKLSGVSYGAEQDCFPRYEQVGVGFEIFEQLGITPDEYLKRLNEYKDNYFKRTGKVLQDNEIPMDEIIKERK